MNLKRGVQIASYFCIRHSLSSVDIVYFLVQHYFLNVTL